MSGICQPSYHAGFYAPKRGGVPRHKSLWRGCVGAWAPCLGPTGLTLRDWSVFTRHGVLTNGPTWRVTGGRYGVLLDGNDDRVSISNAGSETLFGLNGVYLKPMSVSAWFISSNSTNRQEIIQDFSAGAQSVGFSINLNGYGAASNSVNVSIGGGFSNLQVSASYPLNTLLHAGVSFDGNTSGTSVKGYFNGSFSGSRAPQSTGGSHVGQLTLGGGPQYGGGYVNGSIIEVVAFNRVLSHKEFSLLGSRPGIAMELSPCRRSRAVVPISFRRSLTNRIGSRGLQ